VEREIDGMIRQKKRSTARNCFVLSDASPESKWRNKVSVSTSPLCLPINKQLFAGARTFFSPFFPAVAAAKNEAK
jgi:hypothetical protein